MKKTFSTITRGGIIALALGALCTITPAYAVETKNKNDANMRTGSADKDFMMEAAKGGKGEVMMGKMAEKKGKSADVKSFGQRMVTDHTKANNELMAVAKKKGIMLNVKPEVEQLNDANFDKEYVKQMVKDHEKDVAAFEKEAKNGQDADVKAFANKTLPTLKEHLKMAKDMQAKMDKNG